MDDKLKKLILLMEIKNEEKFSSFTESIKQLDKQGFELMSDIKLLFDEISKVESSVDDTELKSQIESLKESIADIQLQKGDNGDKGEDGKNGLNGKDGKDGRDGIDGIDGLNGKDGEKGDNGSPDTAEDIVKKINTLESVIERKTIKGLDNLVDQPGLDRALGILDQRTQYLINKTVVQPNLAGYVPTTRTLTINGVTEDLSADRTWSVGTVTDVAALTLGTTGTDLSSSVATGTTTPVITLNVPTASATNRGALSSTDWSTFNNKFTLPSLTAGSVLFSNGTTIAQDNANFFWNDTNNLLGIGTNAPSAKLEVRGISDFWGLQVGNGTVGALFQVYGGKAGFVGFNGSAYNSLDIRSGISTQLFLATNGNAGIGTTSPSSPLHVSSSTNSITGRFTGNGISNRVIIEGTGAGISAISFAETNIGSRWGIGSVLSTQAFVISKSGDLGGAGNLALEIGQSTRNMGIQLSGATAKIHIAAGTATAGTAPLKFTSGTNLTTPEAGAIEYDGTSFFGTPSSATRYNFLMNNLGLAGGQTVVGGTASGNNLTFSSTSNATKGKIIFGTSAYDEVNNRLGIGTTTPGNLLSIVGNSSTPGGVAFNVQNSNVSGDTRFSLSSSNNRTLNVQVTGDSYVVNQKGAYLFTDGGLSNMTFMTDGDVGSGGSGYISFATGGYTLTTQERMRITSTGNIGIGITSPSAVLHLKAGTATAGTAPIKLTSGTNLTTAEAGAFEYNGSSLFFTRSGTLRAGLLMTDTASPFNTYSQSAKGATAFTSGTDNFLGGQLAGGALTGGSQNVMIGTQAGNLTNVGLLNSVMIGYFAGQSASGATTGAVFIGSQAGQIGAGSYNSNFIGQLAGFNASSAYHSNLFGYQAGYGISANNVNFFGQNAGYGATLANDTVGIGQNAGRNATGSIESIYLGTNTGYNATGSGITGDYNIAIGSTSARALTTGSKNVLIGYNLEAQSNTADGQLTIQNAIFGTGNTGTGTTASTGKIGIFAPAPNSSLQVTGSMSQNYVAKTANYTLDGTDYLVDCTANSFTVTLPTAVGITGRIYIIKNTGTATIITMATTSSQTIDGTTPPTITTLTPLRVMSDGANWITI